jgi:hypothetical protein
MPEHIHLLVSEPNAGNPSEVMAVLKQRVSRALRAIQSILHRRENKIRTLCQNRKRYGTLICHASIWHNPVCYHALIPKCRKVKIPRMIGHPPGGGAIIGVVGASLSLSVSKGGGN